MSQASIADQNQSVDFTCNLCGNRNTAAKARLGREVSSCTRCGSTSRMRAMVHLLALGLFGRSVPLPEFPHDPGIRGIGLSDSAGYARPLRDKLGYVNTFFHAEPRLDITAPPEQWRHSLDFLIASDVFEHVPPPAQRAFDGAASLLKPGGVMVFSVPYSLDASTVEHFPELHQFTVEERAGAWTLTNRTRDGRVQRFSDLVFHGGPGQTLEMRLFCRDDVIRLARAAGFASVDILEEPVWEFGIHDPAPWSRPMLMRMGPSSPGR